MTLIVLASSITTINVKFTYYWTTFEEDFPAGTDHDLKSCSGGILAKISKTYWNSLKVECSGRLRSGEYVNGGNGDCSCFTKVAAPLGSKGNQLQSYVSIATNDISNGTKVFVRQLNNIVLPNGKIHNECVRVDDIGYALSDIHIDFYVLQKSNYEKLAPRVNGRVDIIIDSNCIIQSY